MLDLGYQTQWRNNDYAVEPRRRPLHHPNLERLMCAAASNAQFGALLVEAPAQALAQCQVGRSLTAAERRLVLAVSNAADLADFAGRLHALVVEAYAAETGAVAAELNTATASPRLPATGRPRSVHARASRMLPANTTRAR